MLLDEKKAIELLRSPDKKIIIKNRSIKDEFCDIGIGDFGFWARICKKHSRLKKYKELGAIECEYPSDMALCDCKNCGRKAAFYIDFYNDSDELKAIFDDRL